MGPPERHRPGAGARPSGGAPEPRGCAGCLLRPALPLLPGPAPTAAPSTSCPWRRVAVTPSALTGALWDTDPVGRDPRWPTVAAACLCRPTPRLRGGPAPWRAGHSLTHRAGRGHQVCHNYCNDDMSFNLYPLRWLGSNVPAHPSSGNGSNFPPLWQHRCESYHNRSHFSSSCRPQKGLSYLKTCLCSFLFNSPISPQCFMDQIKAISFSYRLPHCHSGLVAFRPSSIHSLFKLWDCGRCRWMISRTTTVICNLLHSSSFFRQSLFRPKFLTAPALYSCCIEMDAGIHMGSHENGVDEENPPPPPVVIFPLMQPRIHLGFWAAYAHCQIMSSTPVALRLPGSSPAVLVCRAGPSFMYIYIQGALLLFPGAFHFFHCRL